MYPSEYMIMSFAGDAHSIIPYSIMKRLGLEYTRTFESVLAMDSRPMKIIGEIQDLCACIHSSPMLTTVMDAIVILLPKAYAMLLGRDVTAQLGGLMSMDGAFMMILHQHELVRVKRESSTDFILREIVRLQLKCVLMGLAQVRMMYS